MKMGETRATVRLHGEKGSEDIEMLVDTGALYTKISPSLARRLGIVPNETIKVKLADGSLRDAGLRREDRVRVVEEGDTGSGGTRRRPPARSYRP
jgi:predicted aspartyl protease